uniref:DUF1542 domain-containing protein n=2 Tax=Streptococcus TaxID=1301 RepID=UPI000C1F298D
AKELNDAKTNAISAINAEADRKNREIDSANLLPADVTKLKQQVEAAKTNGITEVNRATSPQDVTTKKDTAVGAITGISLDEAKRNKAAKELNDAKTNAISAINDDGGQGDANNQDQPTTPSTPAHSGNSTDQATGPSAQQRGTGNSTEAESSQGLSESSATPPARSRRSVAFAGGTQSSQEKQVDKSVLRDLIQDLETRLKDLDGIDQSVIDAAKVILGEGQEALRNADLTEAGLKEMTAKVKEALESLKGKQTTKDEEEMKETSKEQGHLPYGTMIASLLALLGLLLFLIARRKKESELKKLTKELTKVLQESDLTNVDAKVLDQAREALAQAVAFLANEKESDHTEDELIEKLKAILAQLR